MNLLVKGCVKQAFAYGFIELHARAILSKPFAQNISQLSIRVEEGRIFKLE